MNINDKTGVSENKFAQSLNKIHEMIQNPNYSRLQSEIILTALLEMQLNCAITPEMALQSAFKEWDI